MTLSERIARFFLGSIADDPMTLDHVAVPGGPDWREEKLKAAAQKYGRPFKCADSSVPREIIVDGKITTLRPGEKPKATVTPITKKTRKA